jgi:hypothetical protein
MGDDIINLRVQETLLNKPNYLNPELIKTKWSMETDPNRINELGYMGGLIPPEIRRAGVYGQVPGKEVPYRPRPPRRNRVYYEQEEPISRILKGKSETPVIKKPKLKTVFETLFGD